MGDCIASPRNVNKSYTKKGSDSTSNRSPMYLSWRRPTFPHSYPCSIIGPTRLNFRVRDGNGCDPRGLITRKLEARAISSREPDNRSWLALQVLLFVERTVYFGVAASSGGRLFLLFPKDRL